MDKTSSPSNAAPTGRRRRADAVAKTQATTEDPNSPVIQASPAHEKPRSPTPAKHKSRSKSKSRSRSKNHDHTLAAPDDDGIRITAMQEGTITQETSLPSVRQGKFWGWALFSFLIPCGLVALGIYVAQPEFLMSKTKEVNAYTGNLDPLLTALVVLAFGFSAEIIYMLIVLSRPTDFRSQTVKQLTVEEKKVEADVADTQA